MFLDYDIFRITIYRDIRNIGPGKHFDNLFQTMTVRIGFQYGKNSGLRLDGLEIFQIIQQHSFAEPDGIHGFDARTEQPSQKSQHYEKKKIR